MDVAGAPRGVVVGASRRRGSAYQSPGAHRVRSVKQVHEVKECQVGQAGVQYAGMHRE